MPRRTTHDRRSGFWRVIAIVVAAGLGTAAVALVIFASSTKQSQIGVLLGAWAFVIAAPTIVGSRRAQQQAAQLREAQLHAARLHEAQMQISRLQEAQLDATREASKSQEIELRRFGELQLAREAAARREADFRLEIALRGEIERVLADQVGALREEVSALRAEVVDKLGGQLRLERIETTRVIASDLEALQNEIRRLGGSQESLAASQHYAQTIHSTSSTAAPAAVGAAPQDRVQQDRVQQDRAQQSAAVRDSGQQDASRTSEHRPESHAVSSPERPTTPRDVAQPAATAADDIVDAEVIETEAAPAEPQTRWSEPVEPQPIAAHPVAPETVSPSPAAAETARPAMSSGMQADPFAGLPRLTPLPRDLADLLEPDERAQAPAGKKDKSDKRRAAAQGESEPAEDPKYVGRRRAAAEAETEGERSGGRRRAPEDAPDDLMARIHGR